jgi:hypothetical protein
MPSQQIGSGSATSCQERVKRGSRGLGALASGAALCFLVACAALTGFHKLIYAPATGGSLEISRVISNSVSHSFPSELEAKTYLSGAGVAEFDTVA